MIIKEEENSLINMQIQRQKKKYSIISQEVREKFINKVLSKEVTIKEAAKEFGIKFSTSKAILQTYKREGRTGKKKTRQRKPRLPKRAHLSENMEGINYSENYIKTPNFQMIYKAPNSIYKNKERLKLQFLQAQSDYNNGHYGDDDRSIEDELEENINELSNLVQKSFDCDNQRDLGTQNNSNSLTSKGYLDKVYKNVLFQNPFVPFIQNQQLSTLKEEFLDMESIREQLQSINAEKLKNSAIVNKSRSDDYKRKGEFDYSNYF